MQVSSFADWETWLGRQYFKTTSSLWFRGSPASFTRFLLVAIFPSTSNILWNTENNYRAYYTNKMLNLMHGNSRKFVLEVYPPPSAVLLPVTWACLLRHQHCSNLGQSVLVSAGFHARKAREQILTHKRCQQNTGWKRKIWSLASLWVFSQFKKHKAQQSVLNVIKRELQV